MRTARLVTATTLVTLSSWALQGQAPRERNLRTCLSGRYPTLCDHRQLTPEQLGEVRAAELRENLRTCLSGKYPSLCKHSKLTPDEANQVRKAELSENLRVCSSGKYAALCKHDLLTAIESSQVRSAEESENLRACMDGRYPVLCKHALLDSTQASEVAAAEAKASAARPKQAAHAASAPRAHGCESGHWIETVEGDGKFIKLEDGSMWEVNDADTVTTSIWLPISDVVVCDGKIINVDDDEAVEATALTPLGGTHLGAQSIAPTYTIDASANDETFVINGEVFKAKTYCFGFDRGDQVGFASGSAFGACTSATILHLGSGKACEVWCK